MPLQATSGAASYDAFGGGVPIIPNYIEEVFSTWLYEGNNAAQTITNGIDLAGEGGLVWIKNRSSANNHTLCDTVRGGDNRIFTNLTNGQSNGAGGATTFLSNGFTASFTPAGSQVSWTFRKQPKFFDCVTYTGNGVSGRSISHALGSAPGCVIVKRTDSSGFWGVYHRALSAGHIMLLNTTAASTSNTGYFTSTAPTAEVFYVGDNGNTNESGATYVAYLFAHNAGGFGLTGTDNVISCGSYTGNGSTTGPVIDLGYEPQWLLIKSSTEASNWIMLDTMRGLPTGSVDSFLNPNTTGAENTAEFAEVNATGFQIKNAGGGVNTSGQTFIYIAIRRGPMKVPTTGTSVFAMDTGSTPAPALTSGFPVDAALWTFKSSDYGRYLAPRLTQGRNLQTQSTSAEANDASSQFGYMDGFGTTGLANADIQGWMFRRAPGFMDVCCYTGTGSARTVAHNLAAVPELMIVKSRSAATDWPTYTVTTGVSNYIRINEASASAATANLLWNSTAPTSTVFSLGTDGWVNGNGTTYVAYLFASCPGVSKVGSYTGTGTTQQINCGFTGGARFILIKRTDSTGNWFFWDSLRGIVSGNDPYLTLNTNLAQVTNTDWVDPAATGFEISSTAPAAINASGGTFVFLAIA
jgi:hypothetical protein